MDFLDEMLSRGCSRIVSRFSPRKNIVKSDAGVNSGHPHEEILFVLSGRSEYFFNNSIYQLEPGMALLVDSWLPHGFGYKSIDHDLLHCWCYYTNGKWTVSVIEVGARGKITVKEVFLHLPQELSMLLIGRWRKLFVRESADQETVNKLLLLPLNLLLNELMILRSEPHNEPPAVSELLKTFICNCNGRNCSLDKLASVVGLSRCHIAHIFHKETGVTIGDFINSVRSKYIKHAEKYGLSRKEIASELGFSSAGALGNWMRKHNVED